MTESIGDAEISPLKLSFTCGSIHRHHHIGDVLWVGSSTPRSFHLLALQLKPSPPCLRAPERPLFTPSLLVLIQVTRRGHKEWESVGAQSTTQAWYTPIQIIDKGVSVDTLFLNFFSWTQITRPITLISGDVKGVGASKDALPAAAATSRRQDRYAEELEAIPEIKALGPLFKSSAEVELTDAGTEYVVTCVKHTFRSHMVLQVSLHLLLACICHGVHPAQFHRWDAISASTDASILSSAARTVE